MNVATPTQERIKKTRGQYLPPETTQTTKRPYARAVPALEWLYQKGGLSYEQHQAGSELRTIYYGAMKTPGLVSSYGDQRWESTTISQNNAPELQEHWHVWCGQKLSAAKAATKTSIQWQAVIALCVGDLTLEEIGKLLGYKSPSSQKRHARKVIDDGLDTLAKHFGFVRSDYAQHRTPR